MEILALIVRLLIAATFSIAGITKFLDLPGTRKGIQDFGVPEWATRSLGILLPLAELSVAVLLVPVSTILWGSAGTIALLLVFIAGIAINLAQGRKPKCNCFGQVHSEPVGGSTLIRNGILIAGAAFVFWQARAGAPKSVAGWTDGLSTGEIAGIVLGVIALILIAVQGWVTVHLLRQNGRLLLRVDALEAAPAGGKSIPAPSASAPSGLPIGSRAPAFELTLLADGSRLTLASLQTKRLPILLIFSDPDCGPCSALLPDLARWEREHAATLTIALISRGSQKANFVKMGPNRLTYVLLQQNREIAEAYQANATPAAVLIREDGSIASFLAMGSQAITDLVATVVGLPSSNGALKNASLPAPVPTDLKIGQPAPSIRLPDLSGRFVDLSAFKGQRTLVLFWNPSCGYCSKMLPELKQWEEDRSAESPHLLVVSSGSVEANRALGLRASVVLDQTFASGQAFRVRGTPAAVLVDAEGKIDSGVANGAAAVFALANSPQTLALAQAPGINADR